MKKIALLLIGGAAAVSVSLSACSSSEPQPAGSIAAEVDVDVTVPDAAVAKDAVLTLAGVEGEESEGGKVLPARENATGLAVADVDGAVQQMSPVLPSEGFEVSIPIDAKSTAVSLLLATPGRSTGNSNIDVFTVAAAYASVEELDVAADAWEATRTENAGEREDEALQGALAELGAAVDERIEGLARFLRGDGALRLGDVNLVSARTSTLAVGEGLGLPESKCPTNLGEYQVRMPDRFEGDAACVVAAEKNATGVTATVENNGNRWLWAKSRSWGVEKNSLIASSSWSLPTISSLIGDIGDATYEALDQVSLEIEAIFTGNGADFSTVPDRFLESTKGAVDAYTNQTKTDISIPSLRPNKPMVVGTWGPTLGDDHHRSDGMYFSPGEKATSTGLTIISAAVVPTVNLMTNGAAGSQSRALEEIAEYLNTTPEAVERIAGLSTTVLGEVSGEASGENYGQALVSGAGKFLTSEILEEVLKEAVVPAVMKKVGAASTTASTPPQVKVVQAVLDTANIVGSAIQLRTVLGERASGDIYTITDQPGLGREPVSYLSRSGEKPSPEFLKNAIAPHGVERTPVAQTRTPLGDIALYRVLGAQDLCVPALETAPGSRVMGLMAGGSLAPCPAVDAISVEEERDVASRFFSAYYNAGNSSDWDGWLSRFEGLATDEVFASLADDVRRWEGWGNDWLLGYRDTQFFFPITGTYEWQPDPSRPLTSHVGETGRSGEKRLIIEGDYVPLSGAAEVGVTSDGQVGSFSRGPEGDGHWMSPAVVIPDLINFSDAWTYPEIMDQERPGYWEGLGQYSSPNPNANRSGICSFLTGDMGGHSGAAAAALVATDFVGGRLDSGSNLYLKKALGPGLEFEVPSVTRTPGDFGLIVADFADDYRDAYGEVEFNLDDSGWLYQMVLAENIVLGMCGPDAGSPLYG